MEHYEEERARARREGRQYAVALDLGLEMETGAPLPQVIVTERETVIVFRVATPYPERDGRTVTTVDPASYEECDLACVRFVGTAASLLGPPNDEAMSGHPLYGSGLEFYGFHTVDNSEWRAEYCRRNEAHRSHSPQRWNERTHYVFTFHDKTFECLARGHSVTTQRSTFRAVLHGLVDELFR